MIKAEDIYPITTIRYPDHEQKTVMVAFKDFEAYTAPIKLESFGRFISGQTCPMGGYYVEDVSHWLNGLSNND